MAIVNPITAKNVNAYLKNPFVVYVADVGSDQPLVESFHTLPAMTFNFNKEFIEAKSYKRCEGILFTVRKDLREFDFVANFTAQESDIDIFKLVYGGTIDTAGTTLTLDGLTEDRAFWFETCYSSGALKDKIVRIHIPKGKVTESSSLETGEEYFPVPGVVEALPDIDDATTLPTIFFEA